MTEAGAVFRFLGDNPSRADAIPEGPEPGVYAIFAESLDCLPGIALPPSGLVYVGQSGELATHNHFKVKHSGFSSPRRSFGDEGEMRLSEWMRRSLLCAISPFAGDSKILEKQLIKANEPPFNLTNWRNPQKPQIQALREVCKEEAKRVWKRYHLSLP